MKLKNITYRMVALSLAVDLGLPGPALALRMTQSVQSGLEEEIAQSLGRSPSNPAAGLEEQYADRVRKIVTRQVREQLGTYPDTSIGVHFDLDFSKHPDGTIRFPHLALVKGAGEDWWVHLHLQSAGRNNGLLLRLVRSEEGSITGVANPMAETHKTVKDWGSDISGFAPVEGLSEENLGRLFRSAMNPRSLGGHKEAIEKSIQKGQHRFVLAKAVAPPEKVGLFEMLDKNQFSEGPTVKGGWATFRRMDITAGLEEGVGKETYELVYRDGDDIYRYLEYLPGPSKTKEIWFYLKTEADTPTHRAVMPPTASEFIVMLQEAMGGSADVTRQNYTVRFFKPTLELKSRGVGDIVTIRPTYPTAGLEEDSWKRAKAVLRQVRAKRSAKARISPAQNALRDEIQGRLMKALEKEEDWRVGSPGPWSVAYPLAAKLARHVNLSKWNRNSSLQKALVQLVMEEVRELRRAPLSLSWSHIAWILPQRNFRQTKRLFHSLSKRLPQATPTMIRQLLLAKDPLGKAQQLSDRWRPESPVGEASSMAGLEEWRQRLEAWKGSYQAQRRRLLGAATYEAKWSIVRDIHESMAQEEIRRIQTLEEEHSMSVYPSFQPRSKPWYRGLNHAAEAQWDESSVSSFYYLGTSLGAVWVALERGSLGGVPGVSEWVEIEDEFKLEGADRMIPGATHLFQPEDFKEENRTNLTSLVSRATDFSDRSTRPAQAVLVYYALRTLWEQEGRKAPFPPISAFLQRAVLRIPKENMEGAQVRGEPGDHSVPFFLIETKSGFL